MSVLVPVVVVLALLVVAVAMLIHPKVRGKATTPGVALKDDVFSDPNRVAYRTGSGRTASAMILRREQKYLVLQRCAFPRNREFRRAA